MSRLFMLDTDTVSYALRGEGNVKARLIEHRPSELCVSAIAVAELRFGAARRKSAKLDRLLDAFVATVTVMPFDDWCAIEFGVVAAELRRRGVAIGEMDTLIAAHAIALDATLVTNNTKHFRRVRRLKIDNWL